MIVTNNRLSSQLPHTLTTVFIHPTVNHLSPLLLLLLLLFLLLLSSSRESSLCDPECGGLGISLIIPVDRVTISSVGGSGPPLRDDVSTAPLFSLLLCESLPPEGCAGGPTQHLLVAALTSSDS